MNWRSMRACAPEHDGIAYTNDHDFGRIEGSRRCWLTMCRAIAGDGTEPDLTNGDCNRFVRVAFTDGAEKRTA